MKITTKKFERLPPRSGVDFSGLKNFKINSRLVVEKQIKDFINYCIDDAEGVSAAFVLGDWGEGKTDSYERLIEPEITNSNNYLFFLSASRLVNSYDNESVMNFAKFAIYQDEKLLIHIFNAVGEYSDYKGSIPPISKNPKYFVKSVLDSLLEGNEKKIFIFIDEFEELLLYPKTLIKVISGIKEAINGKEYELLRKNGKYKDRIHFFVSCTPDAFFKIQVNDDIGLLDGSFQRRVEKIRLTQIDQYEGLNYLLNLLKYSYNDDLPSILPITNISLFNTLLRVSQRNMGNLTSLFTKIFSSLVVGDELEVLNHNNLLSELQNHEITAFGGQTQCVDDNFDRIAKYLSEQPTLNEGMLCKEIFKLLIGEIRPILQSELSSLVSKEEISIDKLINIINRDIKEKDKIKRSIIRMAPLKSGKSYEELKSILANQNYIKNNYKTFNISSINYSIPLKEFEEKIIFYELNEDFKLIPKVFLPIDKDNTKSFFEEIGEDGASELTNVFKKLISDDVAYLATENILNMVFPTPIPLDLGYFNNDESKLKLWRYVSHNLNDEFEKNILEAFNLFLNSSNLFEIKKNNSFFEINDKETQTSINTKFLVVNGDIKVQDVIDANEILSNDYHVNLVIILYNGEITESVFEALSIRNLGKNGKYQVMPIHFYHVIAKKFIFGLKANNEYTEYVDSDLFEGVCREKLEDLNIKPLIKEWFDYQEKNGLLINQIPLKRSPNAKVFADGLKLYLNYEGSHTPEEIYQLNMEGILKFKKYGGQGFIASDFEDGPSQIIKVSHDLEKNGFLKKIDDKYHVITNPVETKIYEILRNQEKVSLPDLKSYFIIRDRNERIFQDVFLNILKYKGIIEESVTHNVPYYKINIADVASENLKKEYEEYEEVVKNQNFKNFGHFYVRKLRSQNLILLSEFDSFLKILYDEAMSTQDLLKINICSKILNQFKENFQTAIIAAAKNAPVIRDEIETIKIDLDSLLESVVNKSLSLLRIKFDKDDIVEYSGLIADLQDFNALYDMQFSKEDLQKLILEIESKFKIQYPDDFNEKLLDVFGFRNDNNSEPYFNIKIFLLKQKQDKFVVKSKEIKEKIQKIQFEQIANRQSELEERLENIKIKISSKNKLSYYMYKQLENAHNKSAIPDKLLSGNIELTSLIDSSENAIKIIGDRIGLVIKFAIHIEKLNDAEIEFLDTLKNAKNKFSSYKKICDTKNFDRDLNRLDKEINELDKTYAEIDMEELRTNLNKRKRLIDDLNDWSKNLEIKLDAVSLEWDEFLESNLNFIDQIEKQIEILESKENVDEDELSKIRKKIVQFKNNNNVKIIDADSTAQDLHNFKDEINKLALDLIAHYLTDLESKLIFALASMRSGWIDYDDIKPYASKELGMDNESLEKAVEGLISKGYLHRGFSLTF